MRRSTFRPSVAQSAGSHHKRGMQVKQGFPGAVGDTPLIEIPSLSELTGCRILGKAEHMNPGGSIKDRAAKFMIEAAEKEGALVPGGGKGSRGIVVEGTAGNTGIGLALMCRARGYRCVIVMPNNQSDEKVTMLRALGAEVELVEPCGFASEAHYYHTAKRRAAEVGGFWANQFENLANARAHEEGTGPELWRQTEGAIDGFVCSAGTGGTIGGTTKYLKAQKAKAATYLVDCEGSSLFSHVNKGTLDAEGTSVLEGIGIKRVTANFAEARLDGAFRGLDSEAIQMIYFLLKRDGIYVGGSAGLNCVGAVKLARKLGKGKVIATVLCDGGGRYQSRLFNKEWLRDEGFSVKDAADLSFVQDG